MRRSEEQKEMYMSFKASYLNSSSVRPLNLSRGEASWVSVNKVERKT